MQGLLLVVEYFQGKPGVQFWAVAAAPPETSVLVVLGSGGGRGCGGKARGLSLSVSTVGSFKGRKLGLAALRWGRSNSMRLCPNRNSAPSARSSSWAHPAAELVPLEGKRQEAVGIGPYTG